MEFKAWFDVAQEPLGTASGDGITAPWPNVGAIVWGGVGVKGGDTLRMMGNHVLNSIWSIGNHGATSAAQAATIIFADGAYPHFADPGHYIFNTRPFTKFKCEGSGKLEVLLNAPSASDCDFGPLKFDIKSGYSPLCLGSTGDVGTHKNLSFHDIEINGNGMLPKRGTVAAIRGRADAGVACNYENIRFERIRIHDFKATRGVLSMFLGPNANARAKDIYIKDIEFTDIAGLPVDVECAGPDIGYAVPGQRNWSNGLVIDGIKVRNQASGMDYNTTTGVYTPKEFGGAVFASGFGDSLTPGFGGNRIDNIDGENMIGNAGLVDCVAMTFTGRNWRCKNLRPFTFDGCVLLLDSGCYNVDVSGIWARDVYGVAGNDTSGAVVLVLDNVNNCRISGIDADNANALLAVYDEKATPGSCTVTVTNALATNMRSAGVVLRSNVTPNVHNIKLANAVVQGRGCSPC